VAAADARRAGPHLPHLRRQPRRAAAWSTTTSDGKIDEDPLDGYDNDGDGKIDEDYGAISQQEYTCLMRDDTQEAIDTPAAEKHVPLGLQLRQSVYAFSVPGANDFASIEWELTNITNHELDSVTSACASTRTSDP
jgi:hypothetical protein